MNEDTPTIVVDISTEGLVDPLQIGWVDYREDGLIVRAKVVRARNGWPFVTLPTLYNKKVGAVDIVRYENKRLWQKKRKILLEAFQNHVGRGRFVPQAGD